MRGGDGLYMGLIGQQGVALFSGESGEYGVQCHDPQYQPSGNQNWVGTNRSGRPKMAAIGPHGHMVILSFGPSSMRQEVHLTDLQVTKVLPIDIDGEDWFLVVTADDIRLVDPLYSHLYSHQTSQGRAVVTRYAPFYNTFGNLAVGFETVPLTTGQLLFSAFSATRDLGFPVRLFWPMEREAAPIAPPAGFGRSIYLLVQKRPNIYLVCYDLSKIPSP